MKGYRIVFYKNKYDEDSKHHNFKFETFLHEEGDFFNPSRLEFKQFVKSSAINLVSKTTYFNSNDYHDDKYSLNDFSDIGQYSPGVNIYKTEDNPGFDNSELTNKSFILYTFSFYQTLKPKRGNVFYETPKITVSIRAKGNASSSMTIAYKEKKIDMGEASHKEITLN